MTNDTSIELDSARLAQLTADIARFFAAAIDNGYTGGEVLTAVSFYLGIAAEQVSKDGGFSVDRSKQMIVDGMDGGVKFCRREL